MTTTLSLGETLRLRFLKDTFKTDFVEKSVLLAHFMRLRPFFHTRSSAKKLSVYWKPNAKQVISQLGIMFLQWCMVNTWFVKCFKKHKWFVIWTKYFSTRNVVIHTENCKLELPLDCSTTQMERNILGMCNIEESSRRRGFADFAVEVFYIDFIEAGSSRKASFVLRTKD